jgi:hypothetical protein
MGLVIYLIFESDNIKLHEEITHDERKEIVRTLIKSITVHTIFDEEGKVDPLKQRAKKKLK